MSATEPKQHSTGMPNPDHLRVLDLSPQEAYAWAQKNLDDSLDLSGLDLRETLLFNLPDQRPYLAEVNLSGSNLSGLELSGVSFRGADLSDASLVGANLFKASLSGADLSGADLRGASLMWAHLSGANLEGANLKGVRGHWQQGWRWRGKGAWSMNIFQVTAMTFHGIAWLLSPDRWRKR